MQRSLSSLIGWAMAMSLAPAVALLGLFPPDTSAVRAADAPKPALTAIGPSGGATLHGKIVFKGDVPEKLLAKMNAELRDAMLRHRDKDHCLQGNATETTQQKYRLGDNKGVGNVFVWVQPPKKQFFAVSPRQITAAKDRPVELDHPHGAYVPHCLIHFATYRDPKNPQERIRTGQVFTVKNTAPIGHCIRTASHSILLPSGSKHDIDLSAEQRRTPLTTFCDCHPWMSGYVLVCDHPYAALSRSDTGPRPVAASDTKFGTYEIKDLPAGVSLRLYAWHEGVGFLSADRFQGEEIVLKEGDNVKDFEMTIPSDG